MKLLARLYATIDRSYSPTRFNRLYRLQADPFDTLTSASEACKQAAIIEFVSQKSYNRALDIGCGLGHLTVHLAPYCQSILGIDFSTEAIAQARHQYCDDPRVSFQVADIREFKGRGCYDLILCSEVLYYLTQEDLNRVIQHLAELSTPQTLLVLVGRANDTYVAPTVASWFSLVGRKEELVGQRPFAVSLFKFNRVTKP